MSANTDHEELTYIISHDLQEPIRMIGSYLRLLKKKYAGKLDDDAREYIGYAVDGANRMKLMLDDLLKYSRLREEKTKRCSIKLNEAIKEAVQLLEKRHDVNDFKIFYEGDNSTELVADKSQIVQLFLNIFENSIKFNRNSNKKIHVTSQKDRDNLTLCIQDNGIGIEDQYHDKIFEVFRKLHGHSEYPGTGIGLAICKKIIELHGGKIWVESESGEGTNFYIVLPYST